MPITRRSTPGESGPRSTRSPRNTARRPSGWTASTGRPCVVADHRVAEPSSSASSSARQPCTSPMTSNGPVWSRRSLSSRSRTIVGGVDLVRRRAARAPCGTLLRQAAQRAPQLVALAPDDVGAEVAVRTRRVALERTRSRARRARSRPAAHRARGRARPAACGRRAARWSRRRPSAGRRPAACRRCSPARRTRRRWRPGRSRRRRPGRGRSRWRAPRTRPKWPRRERRLARPATPRRARPGTAPGSPASATAVASMRGSRCVKTASWVGGPTSGSSAPTGTKRTRVAVRCRDPRRPRRANSARVHSNRWSRWRIGPGGAGSGNRTLYSAFGVVTTTVAGRACAEHGPLQRRQPRRVDVLDDLHQHGGVEPGQPRVAVGQRGLSSRSRSRWRSGIRSRRSRRGGDLQRAVRHVDADDLGERRVGEQRREQRALAAAEVDDARRARGRAARRAPPPCAARASGTRPARLAAVGRRPRGPRRRAPPARRRRPPPAAPTRARHEVALVGEVAAGDQLALRVRRQPARRRRGPACPPRRC